MAFRTSPQLGPQLDAVLTGLPYYDTGNVTEPSPKLLTRETGSDGHDYIFVKASADVAATTQVTVDESEGTAAGGSGGWYTIGAVKSGDYFWARKGAADAP